MLLVDAAFITTKSKHGIVTKKILMFNCFRCKEQYCLISDDTKVGMCQCPESWDIADLYQHHTSKNSEEVEN